MLVPTLALVSCNSNGRPVQTSAQTGSGITQPDSPKIIPWQNLYQMVKAEVPNEIFPGVKNNPKEFDSLKEKMMTFTTKKYDAYGDYILENEFYKFYFLKSWMDDYHLHDEGMMEEIVKQIVKFSNIDAISKFSEKINVQFISADLNFQAGTYLPVNKSITVKFDPKIVDFGGSLEWKNKFFVAVAIHEIGHYQTLNQNSEIVDYTPLMKVNKTLIEEAKDFLDDAGFDDETKAKFLIDGPPTNLNRHLSLFGPSEENIRWGLSKAGILGHDISVGIDGLSEGAGSLNSLIAETITRINVAYIAPIYKNDTSKKVNDNVLDITKALNYNFFDPNDSLQSFNIMKSLLKNFYRFGDKPRVWLESKTPGLLQNVKFYVGGSDKADKWNKVIVTDKSGNEVTNFEIQHERYPIGFNKNPFNDYEYKYVAPMSYGQAGTLQNKPTMNDISDFDIKIIDNDGNVVPSSGYDILT